MTDLPLAPQLAPQLIEALHAIPDLTVFEDAPLAPRTTWKIGGPARLLLEVASPAALVAALAALDGTRLAVLGNGSNVLVSDLGFDGAVLVLTGALATVALTRDAEGPGVHHLVAGAGASITKLLRLVKQESLNGLWVLGGVPGTVGGAVKMNAGTRWGETRDTLAEVTLATAAGLTCVPATDLGLSYRRSQLPPGTVVASATFRVGDADAATRARLDEVLEYRKTTQPLRFASCGSVFANPPGDAAGRLIEAAGLKGVTLGGLQVAPQHGNWILNEGAGTAADAVALIAHIQRTVAERFGVWLRPEVQRFGTFAPGPSPWSVVAAHEAHVAAQDGGAS